MSSINITHPKNHKNPNFTNNQNLIDHLKHLFLIYKFTEYINNDRTNLISWEPKIKPNKHGDEATTKMNLSFI